MKIAFPVLHFPSYEFRWKQEENQTYIFDICRSKWVVITPEEWVRQHLLHFFVYDMNYPKGLIQVECGLKMGAKTKRFDIVVMQKNLTPWMIVECKAPDVKINIKSLMQASNYNTKLKCSYLTVANGTSNYCFQIDFENNSFKQLKEFPSYQ